MAAVIRLLIEPVIRLNLEANDPSTEDQKKKEVIQIIEEADPSMITLNDCFNAAKSVLSRDHGPH
jgi:hypothetical protein